MNKSNKMLFYIHKVVWVVLAIPMIWTNIAYRHDEELYKQYETVYMDNIDMSGSFVKDKGIVTPMDLFDIYNVYLMMPTLIVSDKKLQEHIFNSYLISDDMTKQEAVVQLEDDLKSRWGFVYTLNDKEFWGIPRDTRLFTLSARILDTSFRDTDTWGRVEDALVRSFNAGLTLDDDIPDETGVFDVYKVYANELGYTNIDIPKWEEMMWNTLKFYLLLYAECRIFAWYSLISAVWIVGRKLIIWRHRRNEREEDKE